MDYIALLQESATKLLEGLAMTLELTIIAIVLSTLLGLVFGLISLSKSRFIRAFSVIYINIFRGTPMMVQVFFIYFGLPAVTGIKIGAFAASIATLSLNAGAYISEIFRAGIQSVDRGQMEAARSLGLSHSMAMLRVILPQAVRTMMPTLINQFIITLKDTSIISVIGIRELIQNGKIIIARNMRSFEMWLTIGIIYFIIYYIMSKIGKYVERKLAYVQNQNSKS